MTTTTLHQQLAQLVDSAPEDFVALRRRLIERVLMPEGIAKEHLVELQQSIDQSLAVCATPRNRLRELHELLDERLAALAVLTRRLEGGVGECG